MTVDEVVVAVLDALATAGIPYMVVGSLASNVHGIPRSTQDANVVVAPSPGSLERLARALSPGLTLQPQAAFERVTGTVRHLVTLSGSSFVCEVFAGSDEAHDQAPIRASPAAPRSRHSVFVASADTTELLDESRQSGC